MQQSDPLRSTLYQHSVRSQQQAHLQKTGITGYNIQVEPRKKKPKLEPIVLANGRLGYSMAPDDLITVTGLFEEEEDFGDTDQILMSIGQQKRTLTWRERKEKEMQK